MGDWEKGRSISGGRAFCSGISDLTSVLFFFIFLSVCARACNYVFPSIHPSILSIIYLSIHPFLRSLLFILYSQFSTLYSLRLNLGLGLREGTTVIESKF